MILIVSLFPNLYQQANCIGGKNEKAVRELLEKSWTEGMTRDECVRLAIKSLLEVVDSGAKNMEIVVLKFKQANEVSALNPAVERSNHL